MTAEFFSPPLVDAALLLVIALHVGPSLVSALESALLAITFVCVIPMLIIIRGVRQRQLTDHHVGVRQQRLVPLGLGLVSILVGLVILITLQAPRELLATIGTMAVVLLVCLMITTAWKISLHAATAAGAVVLATLILGPSLLILIPIVGLIGWARVELGAHDVAQTLAGVGLGALITPTVFLLLR